MVGAFGQPLFPVHRERCLPLVQFGARGAMLGGLSALRWVLKEKAPKALIMLEGTTRAVRQLRAQRQQAQENEHGQ